MSVDSYTEQINNDLDEQKKMIYEEFSWRTVAYIDGVKTLKIKGYEVNPSTGIATIGIIVNNNKNNFITFDFNPDGVDDDFKAKDDIWGMSISGDSDIQYRGEKLSKDEAFKLLRHVKIESE